jgi:uncharacterized protein (TIGR03083 family)
MTAELKTQLIAAHRAVYDGVLAAVADLDPSRWLTPTGCPGWTVHDQLSHIIDIERAMMGDPPAETDMPDDLPHVTGPFAAAVEVGIQARREVPSDVLLDEARTTFQRRLEHLDAMPLTLLQEPLDGPAGMRVKGSQMLRTRVFDMTCHEQDIRRAIGRPGDLDGPHVDIAVEQVVRAWARYLGERVGGHGVVTFVVAGHERFTLDLTTGALHRGDDTPRPDVVFALDAAQLLAIGAGRSDAPGSNDITIEGDRQLAARVLAQASITP